MAKDKKYKSIATQFVKHAEELGTIEQFRDSFLENQPLGLLYKEMMKENNLDPKLLSSYYKLVNLKSAVDSGNIDAINTTCNSFLADFEAKSKNLVDH